MKERVLLVDDDDSFREVVRFHLEEEGYAVAAAADGAQALKLFDAQPFELVVTDLKMPVMDGMGLTKALLAREPETLVIVITAFGDIESAVAAMKAGAYEFLPKPFDRDHFKLTVQRAAEHARLRREVRELRSRLGSEGKGLLFESATMERLIELADRAAKSDATVLIQGESGTGKELLARRIHRNSERHAGPFVALNCGAIPRELLEDELFGHVKGAFTGAAADRKGRFAQAEGGTIFLDEIAELPAELQSRMLRVLQERVVDAVGAQKPTPVDVRVIAATHIDIDRAVQAGRFREDLYYRINVVRLHLPPLRERKEDILPLARHFLTKYSGDANWNISPEVEKNLLAHSWPGNVRELENLCQRAAVLGEERVLTESVGRSTAQTGATVMKTDGVDLPADGVSLPELEKAIVVRALEMNDYNQSKTARFLNIPRHILLYRMEKYGIDPRRGLPKPLD